MSWVLRPWKPQWLIIYSNAFLLSQGWWNRSSQSGFGGPLFCIPVPWHAWVHTCNGQYQQLWLQVAVGAFLCEWWVVSWVLHARLSFSSKKNERHKGSFVYQTESEIAAYGMWYIKWNLSANSHVLSTSRVRRSQKLQSSGSEARRCYDGPSRQLKMEVKKIFCADWHYTPLFTALSSGCTTPKDLVPPLSVYFIIQGPSRISLGKVKVKGLKDCVTWFLSENGSFQDQCATNSLTSGTACSSQIPLKF